MSGPKPKPLAKARHFDAIGWAVIDGAGEVRGFSLDQKPSMTPAYAADGWTIEPAFVRPYVKTTPSQGDGE